MLGSSHSCLVPLIAHDDDVLVVDVGHVGRWVTVRKDALVPLVQDIHRLEHVPVLLQCPRQVGVQQMVATAMAEIADDEYAVFPVLQNVSTRSEEVSERVYEIGVSGYIREIARVVTVAGFETVADSQLAHFMIRSLVQDPPVRRAGDDEIDRISGLIADEDARVAVAHNLRSLILYGERDLGTEP